MPTTKEEIHWSSFRSAVVCLQPTLLSRRLTSARSAGAESCTSAKVDVHKKQRNADRVASQNNNASAHEPQSASDNNEINGSASHENRPQDMVTNNTQWDDDDDNLEKNEIHRHRHRQLELIGLEKVRKSSSWNVNTIDIIDAVDHLSPAHGGAPSHASYATNVLSIAEQQLVETRLKLAMTESERDELEFHLIQGS